MNLQPSILAQPNIPKPLHGLSPRVIKGNEWWYIEKSNCYQSNDFHCAACGVHKKDALFHQWLEAHEFYKFDYELGIMEFLYTVPLCHACHNFIHSGRLWIMYQQRKVSGERIKTILNHGLSILKKYEIDAFENTIHIAEELDLPLAREVGYWIPDGDAEWNEWKLIFDGKEYYSKFKDINQWAEHYGSQNNNKR